MHEVAPRESDPGRRLRVGVVGAGYIAGRHVENLAAMADVEVVGVADPQQDRATALAGRCGGTAYGELDALLDGGRPQALWVCVPPFAHGPVEQAALDRDLPMFVEKPLAADLATAEDLASRIDAAGVLAAVGYHWRWLDTVERAGALLAEHPPRLLVGSWLDKAPRTPWWATTALSGGQVVEQLTHLLDLSRHLAGEVVAVRADAVRGAVGDLVDASSVSLRFASGAVGSFTSSCLLPGKHRVSLEVVAPGLLVGLTEDAMVLDTGDGPVRTERAEDPMVREDRDFVDAVLGRPAELRVPYAEALRSHRLAVAVSEAVAAAAAAGAGAG